MEPSSGIRKLGFRKWYERELIHSHVSLGACLLSGITVAGLVEEVNFLEFGVKAVALLGIVAAALMIGWHAWRRYISLLERAERYGERSVCARCDTYGRFEVLASGLEDPGTSEPRLPAAWMRVQCRKCGNTWRMP